MSFCLGSFLDLPIHHSVTISSYLLPLVSELHELWEGVQMRYAGSSKPSSFRCALLGVAYDLPAARKCCAFYSYSTDLGCSRCFQKLSRGFAQRYDYGNFNTEGWQLRTNARYCSDLVKLFKCKSKTEQKKTKSRLGCR